MGASLRSRPSRRAAVLLLVLGFAGSSWAGPSDERRLDTALKLLYRAQVGAGVQATMRPERALEVLDRLHARPARARKGGQGSAPRASRIPVLVRYAGDPSRLEWAGFRAQGSVGVIHTGSLETDRLRDLLGVPGVQFIQSSQGLSARAAPMAEGGGVTRRPSVPSLLALSTGSGVLVAFIDTGVDVFHQNFRKADGTTRIKYLLDLSDPGDIDNDGDLDGSGLFGGTLYTEADINAALTGGPMDEKDTTGHGTHGLSIAAGDDGVLPGMAPGADLLVVKATREAGSLGFWSVDVVNALSFVDAKAAELGRPYVVNLSLGTLFSSHDGRSLEEQAIDALVGPGVSGKVAVIAAGNASDSRGTRFRHLQGTSLVGIPVSHTLDVPAYTPLAGRGNDRVLLDLWYQGRDQHRISVTGPGCAPVTAEYGTFADTQTPCGDVFVANMGTADPSNGDVESVVLIDDWSGTAPAAGTWTINVEGVEIGEGGGYHGWLAEESSVGSDTPRLGSGADNLFLVGKPGCAYNAITVGSFARHDGATRFRTSWTDVNAISRTDASAVLEDISDFSSTGRTRDGRIKPELTAPGERVVGAVSQDAYPGVSPDSIYRFHPFAEVDALVTENTANHAFGVLQGTSFSAPVVTGLAARVLETNPALDAIQVRNVLINSALADSFTGTVPNDVWGFGKADLDVGDAPLPKDLRITTVEIPGGVLGEQYNLVYTASGGRLPHAWARTTGSLPPGLSLTSSGFLTGKPTSSGVFTFTVEVTDSTAPAQTDSRAYSLQVASLPPLHVVSHVFPVAKIGKPYEDTLEAKGGTPPHVWSLAAGDLPPGLTLFANGLVQGTPDMLGRFNFSVEVQDALAAVARRSFRIKVSGERGEDWDPLGKSTPTVNAIAIDPNDPNRLFVSTRNIDAVFETTNAGDSWRATSINNNLNGYAYRLAISPVSSTPWALASTSFVFDSSLDRWLSRPGGGGGAIDFDAFDTAFTLFARSGDLGLSWQPLGGSCPGSSLSLFRPDPRTMYTDTCISEDGGFTWADISSLSGGGTDVRVSQQDRYGVVKANAPGVWHSVDGGRNWTAAALEGVVCCLDRSPLEPSIVVAGTDKGLFKSSDGGQTWRRMPINNANPAATSLAIDPANPDGLWVGTDQGVFRSADGGLTWTLESSGLIRRMLSAVTLSRSAPTDVLLIAAEGPYVSRTSGNAWTLSTQGLGDLNLREAAVSPADPNLLYLVNDDGLFRSDNRGVTWFEPNPGFDTGSSFVAVDADPFDANTVIASLSGSRGTYRSGDRGLTWTLKSTGLPFVEPTDLAFARDVSGRVFQSYDSRGVFRSENKGDSWVQDGLDGTTVNDVEVAPSDSRYLYARAGTQLYYRNPGVTDWTAAVTQPSRPVLAMAVDAVDPLTAYAGVDHSGVAGEAGGIYRTTDGGANWARISGILDTYDVVSVAAHPTISQAVYAATLNAGVFRSTDGGQTWAELSNYGTVADLTNVLVRDPSNPDLLFAGTEGYGVQVSADKGRTFVPRVSGLTNFDVNAIAFDPDTPSTVYAGSAAGVFKSTNSGTTWATTALTLGEVTDLVTDNEGTTRRIWATVSGQGVAYSADAAATFSVSATGLSSLELTSIEVELIGSTRRIWATTKGGEGIAHSDDLGQTWKAAGGNGLTDRDVNDLTVERGTTRRIWATTSNGVFYSDNAGLSWTDLSLGLPSGVPATSVAIDPNTGEVLVSLFSEGEGGVYRGGNVQGAWQPFNEGLGELKVRHLTSDGGHVVDASTQGTTFYAATAGDGAYASEIRTPSGTPVQITTQSLPDGLVKTAYAATLSAQGGQPPHMWSLALGSLPPGLSLDASTGEIGGEPGQEGLFEFTVQAADQNARTDQKVLSIRVVNPDVPRIGIDDVVLLEGDSGSASMVFTVSLSQSSTDAVSVDYATADGTASAGSDYSAVGGNLTFAPGATSQTLAVAVSGDGSPEPDETLSVSLSHAMEATIADAQGVGTILDNDAPATLSIDDVTRLEGDSGTASLVFSVTLSRALGVGVTVDFQTADGTATAGSDYVAQSGTLTFLAGTTTQPVTLTVTGDGDVEPDETLFLDLANPVNATIGGGQGVGTLVNDDGIPTLSIEDVSVTEGAPNAVLTVRLSPASTGTVSVDFATADGTATSPADYAATSGSLLFPPGERIRTIVVPLTNDGVDEVVETFFVSLTAAAGGELGDVQGQATVTDDDLRVLSVDAPTPYEGNSGTAEAVFTVSLSVAATLSVTVDYATVDGTAQGGVDYLPTAGTLTFPPGTTMRTVAVSITGDAVIEPDEVFRLRLSNASNARIAEAIDGQTWRQLTPTGSSLPRYWTADAYDDASDVLLVFGGLSSPDSTAANNEAWVLRGASGMAGAPAWSRLTTSGGPPASRFAAPAVYDALNNRLMVHAGIGVDGGYLADTWVLTNANGTGGAPTWLALPVGPKLRQGHAAAYDPSTNRLIVFGGYNSTEGELNDVWLLTDANGLGNPAWIELQAAAGARPLPRSSPAVAYDAATNRLVVFGGYSNTGGVSDTGLNDTWVLSHANGLDGTPQWTQLSPTGGAAPAQRYGHAMAYDPASKRAIVFGGYLQNGRAEANDVWMLTNADGTTGQPRWILLAPAGSLPSTRNKVAAGYSTLRNRMALFGGLRAFARTVLDEVWVLADAFGAGGWATILTDEGPSVPRLQFKQGVFTVSEAAARVVITATRLGGTSGTVSTDYATSDGTAVSSGDYVATSGTVSFAPGVTTKTFAVTLSPDSVREGNESFLLALSNPQGGARLGLQRTAVVTITDNEAAPTFQFSASAYTAAEGGPAARITVVRSGLTSVPATVDYATSDGTATQPGDYTLTSGTLSFGPGMTSQSFAVPIVNDTAAELLEKLDLTLSGPTGSGALIGLRAKATLSIRDNDSAVFFSLPAYSVREGITRAVITVKRTAPLTPAATVSYTVSDGSAQSGVDYTAASSGTLSFAPGVASQTFGVTLINDTGSEGSETVNLQITGATEATVLSPSSAVLNILDNEPVVQFSAPKYSVSEPAGTGTGRALVTVKRLGGTAASVFVSYATSAGTATPGTDYVDTSGTLSFGTGVTSKTFAVTVLGNVFDKPNPTVNLALTNPADIPLGTPSAVVLTVVDNDLAGRAQLGAMAFSGLASSRAVTVTVTRTGGTAGGANVDYATSDDTAISGTDYTATAGTLTFGAGETKKSFTVPVAPNGTVNKSFFVSLGATGGGLKLGTPPRAAVWIVE